MPPSTRSLPAVGSMVKLRPEPTPATHYKLSSQLEPPQTHAENVARQEQKPRGDVVLSGQLEGSSLKPAT
eukprot:213255-Amphidinium_carterae.1